MKTTITHLFRTALLFLNEAVDELKEEMATLLCNEAVISKDAEWIKLCDYGYYPNRQGMQDCTREGLAVMVNEFQTRKKKAGRNWRGSPITMGHREAPNKHLPHSCAKLGRVMDMELRSDGPWIKPAWNSLGEENIAEGWAEFPSPEWWVTKDAKGFAKPVKFVGIGMVESPNIPTSQAWTNEEDRGEGEISTQPEQQNYMKLIEAVRAMFALNEDATEEELVLAVNDCGMCNGEQLRNVRQLLWLDKDSTMEQVLAAIAAREAALKEQEASLNAIKLKLDEETAKVTAANEQVAALNEQLATAHNERDEARATHRDALITIAINEGRATPAERETLVTAFNEDFSKAAADLGAKKATHDTRGISLPVRTARQRQLAANEAQAQFADLANARAKEKGISYQTAFNELKRDPAHQELVMDMNG